ncbi:hypothetical protein SAMD00019534_022460 [Acytostelium subglobosum LB1]|uniref:hypothetical protein n=1 Tax=Acytostelium subglobosum LB1 TaxID=1410327 RepID=UPI00064494B8|nr:hypothetical protein SAMD00019534_022460 [Acytostelium subglobosum LB1]GAM19071.1 hypothetical protein SAMD00019534_022460 [Acytostelium subglobosum LB1]|eukprot:XP_012756998.1 hypothetical protein SAMD00019534_022460 [Acytostelium subglobosum LB1]
MSFNDHQQHGHSHGGGPGAIHGGGHNHAQHQPQQQQQQHGHSHGGSSGGGHGHNHNNNNNNNGADQQHQHVFGGMPEVIPHLQILTPNILEKTPAMLREQYMMVLEKYANQQVAQSEYPWSGPLPYSTVLMALEVAKQGDIKDFQTLVDRSNISTRTFVNMTDTTGNTALHFAVLKKQDSFVQYLIDNGALLDVENHDEGQTPLHWSCISTEASIVYRLVEAGADVHKLDKRGYNALMHAAQYNNINAVRYLVERGANLHSTDSMGHTALHWACYQGHASMGRYFIFKGVDINCIDDQGRTPLHWACHKGHKSVVAMLTTLKANRFIRDKEGNTPSDLARLKDFKEITDFIKSKDIDERFKSMKHYNYMWIGAGIMTLMLPIAFMCWLPFWMAVPAIGLVGYFAYYSMLANYWIPEYNNTYNPTILFISNVIWYVLYVVQLAPGTLEDNIVPHLLINVQMWFFFYFFLKLVFMDAGAVSRFHTEESSTRQFMSALEQNKPLPIICPTCLINRPVRSKHCPSCNQCNAKFDHHCIWINNCVAANNQTLFIILIFNYVLLVISGCIITLTYYANDPEAVLWSDGRLAWIQYNYINHTATFFFLVYGPILAFWIGKLGLSQIISIVFNKTTYEQIQERREYGLHGHSHGGANDDKPMESQREKEGQFTWQYVDFNAYNQGKMNNVKEFLFENNKYYNMFNIPIRGDDGYDTSNSSVNNHQSTSIV